MRPSDTAHDAAGADDARRLITANFETFSGLRDAAMRLARAGEDNAAIMSAELAAYWAWNHHSGLFACPELEKMLCEIGRGLPQSTCETSTEARAPDSDRVLHVLTTAHESGGHARLLWRWLENDTNRQHSLVVTDQDIADVPAALSRSATSSGGFARLLKRPSGGFLARAGALRTMANGMDFVVLHTHPYDAVPLVALAELEAGPRVILLNHADHVFWLGARGADFVASLREPGRALVSQRRGVAEHRTGVLPIPINMPPRTRGRDQAKRELGVATDDVLGLTIGSAYKYRADAGNDFVSAIAPVIAAAPKLRVLAIGPENEGEWRRAFETSAGRIRAIGRRSELAPYLEAADICIDSFPFSSTTARLEAGSYAMPLIGFSPHPPGADVLRSDEPSPVMIRDFSTSSFRDGLIRLVDDAAGRERLGARTAALIESTYCGTAWLERLDAMYHSARCVEPRAGIESDSGLMRTEPLDAALANMQKLQALVNQHFIA